LLRKNEGMKEALELEDEIIQKSIEIAEWIVY
jgi:hypothetical protein